MSFIIIYLNFQIVRNCYKLKYINNIQTIYFILPMIQIYKYVYKIFNNLEIHYYLYDVWLYYMVNGCLCLNNFQNI